MNAFRRAGLALGTFPPGPRGTIADVPGVRVGHWTILRGEGPEAVRTGVTAVVPPGDPYADPLPAGAFVLHGHGKAVGLWQVLHVGELESPVLLTNTLAVPRCAEALLTWTLARHPGARSVNPVVLECNDGRLSAIEARPVTEADALAALAAAADEVEEGCVGAGTGTVAFGRKSGIGTASRVVEPFTVGALALPNMGRPEDLRLPPRPFQGTPRRDAALPSQEEGSLVVVLATDAPLLPEQLSRLARRAALGAARAGAPATTGSGDFFLALSVGWRIPRGRERIQLEFLPDRSPTVDGLYRAAAEATEEAIYSALFAATPLVGRDGASFPTLA
ncbi:MAG: P1 family peptidase [Candidatus Bipolaricaulota bacterium]|nr:P1 family peptidase [Candidatus Bipolaricaulota bacterium]